MSVTWDAENRLTQYGGLFIAGYRPDSLRAWKQDSSGHRTYFLYSGGEPIIELDGQGNISAVNTFGPTGLLSRHSATGSTFYTFDAQGSVAQRLDSNGNVLTTSIYDSFGNKVSTEPQSDPWGYNAQSGYYTDVETGLILCTHRYYDPTQGRWLNRDPIGYSGGLNLYGYVGNGPVGRRDPSGLVVVIDDVAEAACVAAVVEEVDPELPEQIAAVASEIGGSCGNFFQTIMRMGNAAEAHAVENSGEVQMNLKYGDATRIFTPDRLPTMLENMPTLCKSQGGVFPDGSYDFLFQWSVNPGWRQSVIGNDAWGLMVNPNINQFVLPGSAVVKQVGGC